MSVFKSLPTPPAAPKKPVSDTRHGITRTDDYAWLRADNWQAMFKDPSILDPEIRRHLEAENTYMNAAMEDTKPLQKVLFAEMRGRIKEDDSSVPMKDGAYAYGTFYVTGGEQPRYFRIARDGNVADETIRAVLLDGDKEAAGKAYFRLAGLDHTSDHSRGIWGYDDKGSEFFTLQVRDLQTGQDLADRIENTGGGGVWAPDGKSFFYSALDENHRPSKVFHHILGQPQSEDRLVYEEADAGFFMGVGGSLLDDFIYIDIHDHETSEYRLLSTKDLTGEPKLVAAREEGIEYSLTEGGDVFYILTNDGGAKDFKIMEAPVDNPVKENWREVVAHKPGTLVISHMAYARHLLWLERKDGLPQIMIRDRATGEEHAIAFAEEAYSLGLQGAAEYDTDIIRFSYSSMTTPSQLYDYNMVTRERTLLKTQEVPSGHNPDDYVTRRVFAPAWDGEKVPVTLLYHPGIPHSTAAPLLALWLRRLRHHHSSRLQHQLPIARRSRLRLCDCPYPRRQGQGICLVRRRQDGQEDEHLQGLRRSGRLSESTEVHFLREDHRRGRIGRRHADGCGCQHGAGEVRRPHRRRSLRRRAQHHARRHFAAHPAGMAGMGQPDRQQGRI